MSAAAFADLEKKKEGGKISCQTFFDKQQKLCRYFTSEFEANTRNKGQLYKAATYILGNWAQAVEFLTLNQF